MSGEPGLNGYESGMARYKDDGEFKKLVDALHAARRAGLDSADISAAALTAAIMAGVFADLDRALDDVAAPSTEDA